jgi:8-amino-7-oxononanoate synthase
VTGPAFTAATATTVTIAGRTLVSFAGCNYLGLAQHPAVLRAAADAIERFGLSTSASRRTTGHTRLHAELEHDIAKALGADAALLLPDGYTANLAALQALAARGVTDALIDERAHRSLFDAARLAGIPLRTFRHADAADAASSALHTPSDQLAILTDGVFTTDGRIAPLPQLADIGATLLVDDCHGFGVVGPRGAGTPALLGLTPGPNLVVTTTLAKGIGCAGGFLAGHHAFVRAAHDHASAFVGTTPASPPLVAAAAHAFRIARTDTDLRRSLARNIDAVRTLLEARGLPAHPDLTPIFAFAPPDPDRLAAAFDAAGVFIPLMDYPQGPAPRFFRLSVSARHTPADLQALDNALAAAFARPPHAARGVPSGHA